MDTEERVVNEIVMALVTRPEQVSVDKTVDDMGILLSLTVAPEDMGRVIGKAGATAKAIRTILRSVGSREGKRVNLKIVEPNGGVDGQK